jgi:hypothetical protein
MTRRTVVVTGMGIVSSIGGKKFVYNQENDTLLVA